MSTIRVASHVHSDWSYDGRWSLEELAAGFARRGYHAVLMAEHDRGFDDARWAEYRQTCAQASREILLVPGIEYSDPTNSVHVPVWGDIPFIGEALETAVTVEAARRAGGLPVLAHPGRRDALEKLDRSLLDDFIGLELWNRKYDGYAPNRRVAELLKERPGMLAFVSLDFHTARQFHPLAMVLDVDDPVSEDSVCDALRRGRARATAFRLPAMEMALGPLSPAVRSAELGRRNAARHLRSARKLRGRV